MRKSLSIILLVGGIIGFCWGLYYLGYHNGLEFMRKSDSGLGGFAEWAGSWLLIIVGFVSFSIGFFLTKDKKE